LKSFRSFRREDVLFGRNMQPGGPMTVDTYTKGVLTIIAACLVWMCLNGVTPVANAQLQLPKPTPVVLVDANGMPVFTAEGLRVNLGRTVVPVAVANKSVPVEVTNRPLPVSLRAIQRTAAWDPIQVQVMREPPTQMPVP
jgi:hypothetical protein